MVMLMSVTIVRVTSEVEVVRSGALRYKTMTVLLGLNYWIVRFLNNLEMKLHL